MFNCKSARVTPRKPRIPVVAKAVCRFADDEIRSLYVTELSLTGMSMFLVAMRLPSVGTIFPLALQPAGADRLPEVDVRVLSTNLDPADATRTGFEVAFTDLDNDDLFDGLCKIIASLERKRAPERRANPRVWTNYRAGITFLGSKVPARVSNLSMTGACLTFGKSGLPEGIAPMMEILIDVDEPDLSARVVVPAEVVRLTNGGDIAGIGVRFLDMDGTAASGIEGLMLYTLCDFAG